MPGNLRHAKETELKASAAEIATVLSPSKNIAASKTAEVWIDVTAASGTTPTLDISIETSPDEIKVADASSIFDVQRSFAQITGAGVFSLVINRADHSLGRKLRINAVIGGTTPSFTFSARLVVME